VDFLANFAIVDFSKWFLKELSEFLGKQVEATYQSANYVFHRYEIFKADFYKYWNQYTR